jgi:2-polyprenyl-6-methoxyphenol hydroxylase-like FAD-dependent oxidoreductase
MPWAGNTPICNAPILNASFSKEQEHGVTINFGTTVQSLEENDVEVLATFHNRPDEAFALVFGAVGVHSRVRELAFAPKHFSLTC